MFVPMKWQWAGTKVVELVDDEILKFLYDGLGLENVEWVDLLCGGPMTLSVSQYAVGCELNVVELPVVT